MRHGLILRNVFSAPQTHALLRRLRARRNPFEPRHEENWVDLARNAHPHLVRSFTISA